MKTWVVVDDGSFEDMKKGAVREDKVVTAYAEDDMKPRLSWCAGWYAASWSRTAPQGTWTIDKNGVATCKERKE